MIVYGWNPVREAVRANPKRIRYVGLANDHRGKLQKLITEAKNAGVPIRYFSTAEISRLASGVHNGVIAELSESGYADLDEVLEAGETNFILILDGIQDPQNFGAILRVADIFGVNLVVIPEHESVGLTATAVKASAGAAEWVKVAQVTNLARTIERLKEDEFWVYAADGAGDSLAGVDLRGKVAIVMGNEGKGIRKNVLDHCDRVISIPMRGHVESLNVATAAAVMCYEVQRQQTAV